MSDVNAIMAALKRQKEVREHLSLGLRPRDIAKLLRVSERTIHRDQQAILEDLRREEIGIPMQAVADAWNERWWKARSDAALALKTAEKNNDQGSAQRLRAHIRDLEKDFIETNQKFGRAPVAPTEVKNVLETGKQFVVRWARPDEIKKKGDGNDAGA